ncbi:membrane protein [Legionella norrlandica]|uniref:Membrane protein n=1 Tax=Legionella norrlandica TaxID=1498499 RepID=A0A0A2SVW7_9GAMM|nr:heparan-alpha-glucosaminide N-acetyltransferase domain-containing protein [Legionella norrlandica]KGP63589.1 membrane protein [Legionella norrlandica]
MNTFPLQSKRILSLDVFRGITIVLMILVNGQAALDPYPILEHAEWNGCSLADLVFPFFLFIVGLTSVISLRKQIEEKSVSSLYAAVIERTIILFLLGLFLNVFPYPLDFSSIRIYGILQRIAVCYFVCTLIYLNTSIKTQSFIFVALLLGYWVLMTLVPVPGYGANQLTKVGSWVSYFDQLFFSSSRLYEKTYDPEGFLGTFPSIATTLSGVLTGNLLLSTGSKTKKFYLMSGAGFLFLLLGWLWGDSFPINKNLWTSSFVLWTSGMALLVFAFCFLMIDRLQIKKWSWFFKVFGMNALFAFVFHVILIKLQYAFRVTLSNGDVVSSIIFMKNYLFGGFSNHNAALLYSICFLFLNFLVVLILYKRNIFIRI